MKFKLKGLFPAVTPYRLAMAALAISLITPILWGVSGFHRPRKYPKFCRAGYRACCGKPGRSPYSPRGSRL